MYIWSKRERVRKSKTMGCRSFVSNRFNHWCFLDHSKYICFSCLTYVEFFLIMSWVEFYVMLIYDGLNLMFIVISVKVVFISLMFKYHIEKCSTWCGNPNCFIQIANVSSRKISRFLVSIWLTFIDQKKNNHWCDNLLIVIRK